ncbi:MAG: hypothetical protein JRI25_24140 [Deltaproteobacteria bacterium]|nr:hypothetical protein [Deltaproteobacteria bacterium]
MRYRSWAFALSLFIVGCATTETIEDTDDTGVLDTGDTDDTGIVDTGDTEVVDTCGDGVVDDGEDCDLGEANDDDGSCATDCTWVDWLACGDVEGVLALDTTASQPDGSFHIHGRFETDLGLSTACEPTPVAQAAIAFTLPSAGDWVVSTNNPGTDVVTSISLRTDCDERAEVECVADNAARPGAASLLLEGAGDGERYVVVIEQLDAAHEGWHLSVQPVNGLAEAGESCDQDILCAFDSTCVDGTCVALTDPTVDTVQLLAERSNAWTHVITGTDPNRDAVTLQATRTEDSNGVIYGEESFHTPIVFHDAVLTWDGDIYTFVLDLSPNTATYAQRVSVDFQVLDASGRSSEPVRAEYPERPTSTYGSQGDECDMDGYPRNCNYPNKCTVQETGPAVCDADVSPTLTQAALVWERGVPSLAIDGFDPNHYLKWSTVTVTSPWSGMRGPSPPRSTWLPSWASPSTRWG